MKRRFKNFSLHYIHLMNSKTEEKSLQVYSEMVFLFVILIRLCFCACMHRLKTNAKPEFLLPTEIEIGTLNFQLSMHLFRCARFLMEKKNFARGTSLSPSVNNLVNVKSRLKSRNNS